MTHVVDVIDVTKLIWSDFKAEIAGCDNAAVLTKWRDEMAVTGRLRATLMVQRRFNLVRNRAEVAALKAVTAAAQREVE